MTKSNREMGQNGEDLACEFLRNKGWDILARNYYAGHSEIDIIAKDGNVIVFLEVKMRSTSRFGQPIEFVNEQKIVHVYRAAEHWVHKHKMQDSPLRFDIIGILTSKKNPPEIAHYPDAFR